MKEQHKIGSGIGEVAAKKEIKAFQNKEGGLK